MIQVITPPAAYPVTVTEAREWARAYSDDAQDATLAILIAAMTAHAEHITGRAFVERTLQYNCDAFRSFDLLLPPLLEVVSIKYTDSSNVEQTVAASTYEVDTTTEPGRVRAISGAAWPAVGPYFNPVRIRYKAGYRPSASPTDLTDNSYLPAQLRLWIAARIATLYNQREHLIDGRDVMIARDLADALLDPLILGGRLF